MVCLEKVGSMLVVATHEAAIFEMHFVEWLLLCITGIVPPYNDAISVIVWKEPRGGNGGQIMFTVQQTLIWIHGKPQNHNIDLLEQSKLLFLCKYYITLH